MRMMLNVTMPNEPFSTLVRENKAGKLLERVLEELKPEAAYFTETDGLRSATLIVNVSEPSRIPSLAEPFFLNFNAECRFRIVMLPEEIAKAGLEDVAKKWGRV